VDRGTKVALGLLSVGAVLALYLSYANHLLNVSELLTALVAGIGGGALLLALAHLTDDRPTIRVDPLPHKRGYIDLPLTIELDVSRINEELREVVTHGPYSHPEGPLATNSQLWDTYWASKREYQVWPGQTKVKVDLLRFIVKFGVLRVSASGGDAIGCRSTARFRHVNFANGNPEPDEWVSFGPLNWFFEDSKDRVFRQEGGPLEHLYKNPSLGLNAHLKNSQVDIYEGETADLPLFYMRLDQPLVYLCGPTEGIKAGAASDEKPIVVDFEISISARRHRKKAWMFRASVKWEDYRIERSINRHWWHRSPKVGRPVEAGGQP